MSAPAAAAPRRSGRRAAAVANNDDEDEQKQVNPVSSSVPPSQNGVQMNGNVNFGIDPATVIGLLQQQLQASQSTNERLLARLDAMEQAQQERSERPDSRPLPDFKGSSFKGEADQVDAWLREARLQLKKLAPSTQGTSRAVDFLAQAFQGAALVWFSHELDARQTNTPEELFTALRARFQPKLAAEDARRQLRTLEQGKQQSVTEYAAHFRELLSLLPSTSYDEITRVEMFRDGLVDEVRVLVARNQPQPSTLEAMTELASRVESTMATSSKRAHGVASMEGQPGSTQSLLAAINSLGQSIERGMNRRGEGQQAEERRRRDGSRGPPRRSPLALDSRLEKQSREQRVKLANEGKCFYCAATGHIRSDCPVAARGAPPTPAALGN
jgi:hypothetical protein